MIAANRLLILLLAFSCCFHGCNRERSRVGADHDHTAGGETASHTHDRSVASGAQPSTEPITIVVWISVDGFRGDYVDKANTPFLDRLMREGAYSRRLAPVFPSLTFPAHVSQCTGTFVEDHGIIANALYDLENDRRLAYPNDNSLILSESIWTTAKRQGRRVAVYDWPVSQKQAGPHAADYFDEAFDPKLEDEHRLQRLWDVWRRDKKPQPLQLLMGYFPGVDAAGHKYGPNAPETKAAVEAADRLLAESFASCQQLVRERHGDAATLYFIISTDHGMEEIHTLVNLAGILADAFTADMRSLTSGSVGNIYLSYIQTAEARDAHAQNILQRLRRHKFLRAYLRDDLPQRWGYNAAERTGDIVVSLDPGYFFSDRANPPITPVDSDEGPLGMHGYPVEECPNMYGLLAIWRSDRSIGGIDLGEIDSRRLHATVARMLDIGPAPTALDSPLPVVRGD
jgi:predicted AlkP superfamily pyrophosphatase or phosphodiesterase